MEKVKLVKQSYKEARESGLVGPLDLVGIVTGSSSCTPFTKDAIEQVDKCMIEKAKELSATYIFGVEYKGMAGDRHGGTLGFGDAYKPVDYSTKQS